jgi:tripartite-type tricarboxylate transporter receptor subunit TctC
MLFRTVAAAMACVALLSTAASAQKYPSRNIEV